VRTHIGCPYCGGQAKRAYRRTLYPHRPDLAGRVFFRCAPCDAYVGCRPGTDEPLGTPAGPGLRRLRGLAHAAFDPLWLRGGMSRSEAYLWLSERMGLSLASAHIGMFNEDQCRQAVAHVARLLKERADEKRS
jgi:uncharacterized protein DUF3268